MRGADQNGVNRTGMDHGADIGEPFFVPLQRGQRSHAFAERSHDQPRHFACPDVGKVRLAHVSKSDDSDSDVLHRDFGEVGKCPLRNRA